MARKTLKGRRETYPNAPLQFVAWELRTPSIPEFQTPGGVVERVSGRLRDIVPIVAQPETAVVVDTLAFPQQGRPEQRQRMLDRKQMLSVTIGPTATVIETTSYTAFENFEETIARVLNAIESAASVAGFERVGLRYIDEVRVPEVKEPTGWGRYVNETLLSVMPLGEARIKSTHNLVEYDRGNNLYVTMRSGALDGRSVDSSGPLRLAREEIGPYFLIDLDSYWLNPRGEPIPEFSAAEVSAITKELRVPVRQLFEASVTETLRDEVFRRQK